MHTAIIEPRRGFDAPPTSQGVEAETVCWTFPAGPVHVRFARRWFGCWLEQWYPASTEQIWSAVMALSELLSNAVLHGAGPITVRARLSDAGLECEVTDRCPQLPQLLEAAVDDECHRGMNLVEALTARWEVRAAPGGGKAMRFLVDLTPDELAEPE